MTSYLSKVSSRINIQLFGFVFPSVFGSLFGLILTDFVATPGSADASSAALYLPSYLLGVIPLILLTSHLWSDDYFPYQLERQLFIYFSYKSIFTSTFAMLNRRLIDLEQEFTNINLSNVDDNEGGFKDCNYELELNMKA